MKKYLPIPTGLKIVVDLVEWVIFGVLLILFFTILSPFLPTNAFLQSYIVPSGSMEPIVHVGSIVLTHKIPREQLHKGDIISFTDPLDKNKTILHRIYQVTPGKASSSYKTKGDHNSAPDPWVVPSQLVKGKVLIAIPYAGYVGDFAKKPVGFIILIVIPAILLTLLQVKKIKEGIEEEIVKRTQLAIASEKNHKVESLVLFVGGSFLLASICLINKPHYSEALFSSSVTVKEMAFSTTNEINKPPHMPKDNEPDVQFFLDNDHDEARFTVSNMHGYTHLSYLLTFDTNTLSQGVSGETDLRGKKEIDSGWIFLGTCSQGVCIDPKGLHDVKLELTLFHGNKPEVFEKRL